MSTITVSNKTELMNALANAQPGDTILLESGDYGSVTFSGIHFTDYVTIKSADGAMGAVFSSIVFDDSSYLRVDNVHVANPTNGDAASKLVSVVGGSEYIQFVNSEVHGLVDSEYQGHYGLHAGDATHVLFENNYIHDVKRGIVAIGPDDIQVIGNTIDYIGDDSMKFGNNDGVLIENNTGAGHIYPAPGAHLDFIQFQASATNITIRGNVLLPDSQVSVQGIFMDDGFYSNVVIENNLIYNASTRGISISAGTNITATYNTLLTTPDFGHKGSLLLLPSGSVKEYNIQSSVSVYAGQNGTNITIQWDDPSGPYYYDSVFKNASQGFGVEIDDLAPVAGSVAESYGAYSRIGQLLGTLPPDTTTDTSTDTGAGDTSTDTGGTDTSTDTGTDTSTGTGSTDSSTDTGTDTSTGTGSTDTSTDTGTGGTDTSSGTGGTTDTSGDTIDTGGISEPDSGGSGSLSDFYGTFFGSYSLFTSVYASASTSFISSTWDNLNFSSLFNSTPIFQSVETTAPPPPEEDSTAGASDGSLFSGDFVNTETLIHDLSFNWQLWN